jgi:dephospho-CoA kinase
MHLEYYMNTLSENLKINSKPKLIGITGGIGSGKSYVCNLFKNKYGIKVFNTDDQVQNDVLKREQVKRIIIAKFGENSYMADGFLNKELFKELIKGDLQTRICCEHIGNSDKYKKIPTPLQLINEIVCPELRTTIKQWGEGYSTEKYVLIESAIIFETGMQDLFDITIVVTCPINIRLERLEKRGLDGNLIDSLILKQWSDREKINLANIVIENDAFIEDTVDGVHKFLDV